MRSFVALITSTLFISGLLLSFNGCESSRTQSSVNNVSLEDNKSVFLSDIQRVYSLENTNGYDIKTFHVMHPTAYTSEMCYTKTIDENKQIHNPCFACHTQNTSPNYIMDDVDLQEAYAFAEPALKNPYLNHFKDFSDAVSEISDIEMLQYIKKSNYFEENGSIILENKLLNLSAYWDLTGDGVWSGYIPDCYYNFDLEGFDIKPDMRLSGWRAFAYMPFLGTFWPTNGSTDDVLIRLDSAFMIFEAGGIIDKELYSVNLAIVEALIKREDVFISEIDERKYGVDLNKDGKLDITNIIKYEWAPRKGKQMSYVGYAKELLKTHKIHLAAGLFPEGTEFLHSVRYVQSDTNGSISLSPRMKELRYAKKSIWLTYANLQNKGLASIQEKDIDPDKLEIFRGNIESGIGNNMGWVYQGFIEDKYGDLRPQSYEETLSCMGCHSGLAITEDSIFSFSRKFDSEKSHAQAWYHWSAHSLKGVPENRYSDGTYELSNYLKQNNSGDEFRENDEVFKKFFLDNAEINSSAIAKLHNDVTELLFPSYERAMKLNKAYKALVQTQTFIDGRAGHISPFKNVHKEVQEKESTGLKKYIIP